MQQEGGGVGRERPSLSKRPLTICVVGSGGVGKSSLTIRFLKGVFTEVSPADGACVLCARGMDACLRLHPIQYSPPIPLPLLSPPSPMALLSSSMTLLSVSVHTRTHARAVTAVHNGRCRLLPLPLQKSAT